MKFSGGGRRAPLKSERERLRRFLDFVSEKQEIEDDEMYNNNLPMAYFAQSMPMTQEDSYSDKDENEKKDREPEQTDNQLQGEDSQNSNLEEGQQEGQPDEQEKKDDKKDKESFKDELKKEWQQVKKNWQIFKNAKNFLGLSVAAKGPIGECPHCKQQSIYCSSKATDKLIGAFTNNTVTYYCMNNAGSRKSSGCVFSYQKGYCYRKMFATPEDKKQFDKMSASEWLRIFRIDR